MYKLQIYYLREDMNSHAQPVISIIVPLFNEGAGLSLLHTELMDVMNACGDTYELIYVNDGSTDTTRALLHKISSEEPRVRYIELSKNFGKEYALSAGLAHAKGSAALMLDGDGQHPIELIPDFINAWKNGSPLVIGVRNSTSGNWLRRKVSRTFYSIINKLSNQDVVPYSTDFRLLDREVVDNFLQLQETGRVTRMLIDWLGYEPQYIQFTPKERTSGTPGYTYSKMLRLAIDALISKSDAPLRFFLTLGLGIALISGILGLAILIDMFAMSDPLGWNVSGGAMVGVLMLFLVGLVLISQGVLSQYVATIHAQVQARPLYVINRNKSRNL